MIVKERVIDGDKVNVKIERSCDKVATLDSRSPLSSFIIADAGN